MATKLYGLFSGGGCIVGGKHGNSKIKRAYKLVVHIDKFKPYLGNVSASWEVGDSLDAAGGYQTESSTPLDFIRVNIPANPNCSDIESEYEVGSSVGNPSTPSIEREGSRQRGTDRYTPLEGGRPVRMRHPHAHLRDYLCRTVTMVRSTVHLWFRRGRDLFLPGTLSTTTPRVNEP